MMINTLLENQRKRDIEKAVIPSFIKKIGPRSFELCDNLKEISFSENSQLLSIGHQHFIDHL